MKNYFVDLFHEKRRKTTVALLISSISCVWGMPLNMIFSRRVLISSGLIAGIDDNPPGIILLYAGIICLMIMFIHHWRTAKKFLILFVSSIVGLIVLAVLHNVMHGLNKIMGDVIILSQLFVFGSVFSFLIAVIVCPPGILVGAVGTIVCLFKNKNNHEKKVKLEGT